MAEYIGSVKKDDTDMLETTFVQDGDIRQMVVAPKGTSVEELKKLARKQKLAPLYSPEYTKALNTALARRRDPLPEPRPINFRDWRPKKEEETNPIVTFGKSAINQVSELTVGTASMLYAYGNEAGAQLAQDLHGEELSDEAREKWRKEIEEIGRKGWEKSRAVKDMFQFDNTPGESETAQNAGSLITPYLLMGLGYLATGGVAPLVALYGTSSGLGTIENARLKGDTPKRALMRGVASGFAEAGLERVGANVMISSITNKRLYPLMNRFVFPAWGGVVQEGLQTAKDMAINYDLEPVTADEALDQILTASMWGAFGELAGTQIGYMRNREMIRRSVEEKALAAGHDAKTAKKIARAATPSVNELAGDITETLRENNEQLEKFTFEQMEEYEKSIELARNLPTEDAAAEVQFYDGVKSVILKSGIDENEARRQASYWSLMVKNDYELAKENGAYQGNMAEFQRDWLNLNIANRTNVRTVKIGNRVVETSAAMTEEEINEAWQERNAERQMTAEERYREESQRGVLFSKENLTTREDGYSIADDNEVVDVVNIPDNAVPDFKTKTELRNWLIGKFEEIGNITIESTGANVDFNKTAAQKVVKNARNRTNNIAYPEIEKIVSGAKYSGFRSADEKHKGKVRGQDVYHSGVVYKGKPYSVEFYVDVPLNAGATDNFAGNKIRQIRIEPADTQVTSESQNSFAQAYGSIHNISLAVLRGKVNPARQKNGKLFSKAYVSMKQPLQGEYLDAERFEGTGEGIMAHGWGNYLLKDRVTNKVRYFNRFNQQSVTYQGKLVDNLHKDGAIEKYANLLEYYHGDKETVGEEIESTLRIANMHIEDAKRKIEAYDGQLSEDRKKEAKKRAEKAQSYGDLGVSANMVFGEANTFELYTDALWTLQQTERTKTLFEQMQKLNPDDFEVQNTAAQYEAEVPEDDVLLDEQKPLSEQSDFVKSILEKMNKDSSAKGFLDSLRTFKTDEDIDGEDIYQKIAKYMDEFILDADGNVAEYNDPFKQASLLLAENGIKGIKYDGKVDGEGYVIFDGKDVTDYNRLLSSRGETVQGTYDPSERLIELFADAKPDTLTHELSHHFFQNHFRVAQEYGFSDYDRGVMKWLSKRGKHDITGFADMQDQDWENLTEAFIRYLNTDTAPTIATRGLFQKAKEWVLGVYDDNRDYASNEVKDFFDALVSREGTIPNLDNIIKNKADFEESIKQALRGESATFRGMNRGELRKLRQATHTRVRRPGRTLEQELRALGYRVDAVNRTLADEKGVVDDARLAEILQEMGVLDNVDTETYEQTDALSAKMQDILANAATTYSPREAKIQQERDASIRNQAEAQRFIDELLQNNQLGIKTIEELDELLAKVVSKPDDVDIVKVNRNAIKYLQAKTAEMNKDYREAIRQIRQEEKVRRETQYQLQNRMKNFIRSLPVTGDHKASLMGNIQRVKDAESFEAVLNDVRRRAAGYIEQEQKQLNRRNIEETIKSTKPTKFRKQRYTYEDNKFFAELRDILKMSRAEALRAQEAFAGQIGLARADGEVPLGINISEYDRLKNLLYYYKINGAESSLVALQDLATSLEELKAAAADKRLDEDTLKSEVRKKDKDELLEGINKYKASNIFARGMAKIGTIRSAMSEYFGKEMADKWNLEPAFERVNIFMRSRIKPVMDSAREIYGAAKASDFLNLMQNKSQKEFELTDNDGDYDKLSIMDIADIYIGMKDPNTRANYYAAYEKFDDTMPTDRGQLRAAIETMSDEQLREHMLTNNLGTLLSYLSEQDMRFADMVQEEVGSMWELENEIFVKLYGIDLPQNRNYFPRTSKNAQDYDVMENLRVRGQTPGFFKERASTVTPRPKNIWTKYQEYVTSVGYVQNVALKYKDLHSLMTDKAIRGAIVKKYGEDSYRAFMANLDDLSIKGAVKTYNEVGRTMQKLLNNLVSGTVALNVPMAFKQLPAALNYSVNMPKTEFIKNFLYAATHPAEVKRVMDSYVGDFLKTRYEQGSQSDAIGRAMAEADSLVNSKFGLAGFSHNWRQLATTPIRFADIFAIYWGGYAKLKYNIDRGLAPEKIREDFIDETLSNQAAGNPATLAKFQREQSLRFFTAFRNVPAQYMRLITTTMTQWRRGEISDARFFSNIGNYVFVQPALYIWLGWLVKSFLYGDDDDEWFDGMMTEMALSPIAGLPIIADLASFGLDKAESALTGKSPEPWDALQVFGVDTLNKLMWKLVKDDKTGWDWAEIAASVIDVGTGAGLGTAVRTVKKLSD